MGNRTEIFETMPVRQAVIRQIAPAIASQMTILIYNLADTFFVGMLNRPEHTAAVTVAYPLFLMLTAISNLFGVGGASALARALGKHDIKAASEISAVSFWCGMLSGILYALLIAGFAGPLLRLCGASDETYALSFGYVRWVILAGGTGTVLNTLMANLVRAEGSAVTAFAGVSLGGAVNILLDPLFVLPRFLGMGAEGAGLATALSNLLAVLFFLQYIFRNRKNTVLRVEPGLLRSTGRHIREILSVGFPSALQYALTVVAVAAQTMFVSKYATEAIAGLGIAKKLDQLPLYFSIGTANGLLPLLAYNHAGGNLKRRDQAFRFGCGIAIGFSLLCLVVYECAAPSLARLFIRNEETIRYAALLLRIMVLAMPLTAFCYPVIVQFQAIGAVKEALICSILRKGVLDIPLLFLLDGMFPLIGCAMIQPLVDAISMAVAIRLKRR